MFIMHADGSGRRVLFERATESALGPVWGPRGDMIAFGLGVAMPRQGQYGPSQIAIISPDGSGFRRVTPNDKGNYHFPDWSPDGKRLVFVMRADGSDMRQLTDDAAEEGSVTFTPK